MFINVSAERHIITVIIYEGDFDSPLQNYSTSGQLIIDTLREDCVTDRSKPDLQL